MLEPIPTTGYNIQEFYAEEPTDTSDDVVMGEGSDSSSVSE